MIVRVVHGRLADEAIERFRSKSCPVCRGSGQNDFPKTACHFCKGTGQHPHPEREGYAYSCREHVEIGDVVMTPPNWLVKQWQEATVIGIGAVYDGQVSSCRKVPASGDT
jgi:hypothetical protein